ncbi:MAG TPA: Maf family nucleotide pyrophosphatase [Chloroflexota bacterium]
MLKTLVLGSASPYRRSMLDRLRLPFIVEVPAIDETTRRGEAPSKTAIRLAQLKAKAVGDRHPEALVIGCDQVLELDGRHLGKPGTNIKAFQQIQAMQGHVVLYHSALVLLNAETGKLQRDSVLTTVRFRSLEPAQIERYLDADSPFDIAGAVKAEGLGIALMESAESADPTAIIGLPLIALTRMLIAEGVEIP